MKLHIDYDDDYPDPDITIRAAKDSPALAALLARLQPQPKTLAVFQGNREHFLPLADILFIETAERTLQVHTTTDIYVMHTSLASAAALLPPTFQQIAKSTIVNLDAVSAVERAIANCAVSFYDSYKQVYASRRYYKQLLRRLEETRSPS